MSSKGPGAGKTTYSRRRASVQTPQETTRTWLQPVIENCPYAKHQRPPFRAVVVVFGWRHEAGLVEHRKDQGFTVWRLTSDGRQQLSKARRKREDLTLPEVPQHREWRTARAAATERIDIIRKRLRDTLSDANRLLESAQGGDSDSWFDLAKRLSTRCDRLGSATYCLREWPEPDDAHADPDDSSAPNSDSCRNFYWMEAAELGGSSCDRAD